jgi:hypothetical protein
MKRKYKVPRPRNAGTMTEAEYWGKVRSALRMAFRYWRPMKLAMNRYTRKVRVLNTKTNRMNTKKEIQCQMCMQWFREDGDVKIHKDHINEVGSLKSYDDLAEFLQRLTDENIENYQPLCKPCHDKKTHKVMK